ncbi:Hypothetical protein R9X50_00276600 [Acrodontium crateriforme]|uniref:TauD/TfdA-like domain-containing protein n=1 Tax=Acrodontium crateriforme TaxID=150365 RepID=A0AAQ3M1N8_9PEZI|nr:Hypothetical protein R9X50_00276600 [Acrodontium crateriforme]
MPTSTIDQCSMLHIGHNPLPDDIPYFTRGPLKSNGLLDTYDQIDLTPVIGTEFRDVNLVGWMKAPNADELLRELALIVSTRGVVVFRAQTDLCENVQKDLIQRLGVLSGKPTTSNLHIHPILNTKSAIKQERSADQNVGAISSKLLYSVYGENLTDDSVCTRRQSSAKMWHTDCGFEAAPADYSLLRMTQLPPSGGDTLFASTYELYDRISPPMQRFLSNLTATFGRPDFKTTAARSNLALYSDERGSIHNVGTDLTAVHPVVRTNPVTGWRSVFPVGQHVQHVNGVTPEESKMLLDYLLQFVLDNHDLQVRLRWENNGDVAIFDNRSCVHTATLDYEGIGDRFGSRIVGIGERPFLDLSSKSRREDLADRGVKIAGYFPARR